MPARATWHASPHELERRELERRVGEHVRELRLVVGVGPPFLRSGTSLEELRTG